MSKKKTLKRIMLVILLLIVGITVALLFMFRHELKSLSTLEEKSEGAFVMTYDGDYGFDEFLFQGAKSDSDIEAFVTKRLLKGLPIEINVTGAGCTAFVTRDEAGNVLFGRNFDFPYSPFVQVYTCPDNGYKSVSTINLSFAGYSEDNLPTSGIGINNFLTLAAPFLPFDGMNEKGVCMALLAVPETQIKDDPGKVTLNTTTAIRLVLDKAANVDEAVELLKQYNIYFSGDVDCHFLIADATGKSVLVEYYDGGLQVVTSDADYQVASNFIAYKGINIGEGFSEFDRYDSVCDMLETNNNIVSQQQCIDKLNEIGVVYEGVDKLQWSVVYNLTQTTGHIWPHRNDELFWDFDVAVK